MGKTASVIFEDMKHCFVCGSPYVQVHHIFYGTANRKLSDKYGYIAPLCAEHHTGSNGVHFNKHLDMHLKKLSQEHFERQIGAREEFRRVFGKSYL
ncbi:hypothetical protein [Bacillus infantis]|uniref:hypothetical protein n=1 Tax=Bacillus infantis TaxID=324767 RepID=UPI003CF1B0DB